MLSAYVKRCRLNRLTQASYPGTYGDVVVVDDLTSEVARPRAVGVRFRNDVVKGPGGSQILFDDPSGNPVELFQPARREPT